MSAAETSIRPTASSAPAGRPASRTATSAGNRARLLFPREHGAWGMISLPFLAGALVGGNWVSPRMAAAALAVLAVFLLREPLVALWRSRAAARKYGVKPHEQSANNQTGTSRESVLLSLFVYGAVAAGAGLYLLQTLPIAPLAVLGASAALLTVGVTYAIVHNFQRHPALQILSVVGLTASSLLAYLAARGSWDGTVLWIWGLSAAHSATSVLVVHARLEALAADRQAGRAPTSDRRNAWLAQGGLLFLGGILAASGRTSLLLPFLPPLFLHVWELWLFRSGLPARFSMRRVGWTQLGASVAFYAILISVLS